MTRTGFINSRVYYTVGASPIGILEVGNLLFGITMHVCSIKNSFVPFSLSISSCFKIILFIMQFRKVILTL